MRALVVEEGKLDAQAGRDFLNAMNLREAADYEAEFSEAGEMAVIIAAYSTPILRPDPPLLRIGT